MDTKRISKDKGKCAVQNCPSTRKEPSHQFPKSTIIASRWIEAARSPRLIGLTPKQVHDNRYVICHLHFRPQDYQCSIRRKLKEGTVPSLLLPEETDSSSAAAEVEEKIDMDRKEDSSHEITITPSNADFSPVKLWNSYQNSAGSNSDRRTCSLATVESGDSIFPTTPKSTVNQFRTKSLRCADRSKQVLNADPGLAVLNFKQGPPATAAIGQKEIATGSGGDVCVRHDGRRTDTTANQRHRENRLSTL